MNASQIWRNQTFCFRLSLVFIMVWLAISSTASLIIYFSFGNDGFEDFIFDFSTWFFILPALTFFGLINAIPLLLTWLLEPLEKKKENKATNIADKKEHSYAKLASQLGSQIIK